MDPNLTSESALKFFGGARPLVNSMSGSRDVGYEARVVSGDPSNGYPTDYFRLPPIIDYNRTTKPGAIHFAIFNMSGLNTLGIKDENNNLKILLSTNEGVYVSLGKNSLGVLNWVFHNKGTHSSSSGATAPHPRPIFLHGEIAGPTNSDTGEYYDYATKNFTTVSAAGGTAIDHVSGGAAYGFATLRVYLVGSSVSHTVSTDATRYDPFGNTWISTVGASWLPTADSSGLYVGYSNAIEATSTDDIIYSFGRVTSFGNFSTFTTSWTLNGTYGPTMFGGVGGTYAQDSQWNFGLGASTDKWFECVNLHEWDNSFVRRAMMPARKRTGSGGPISSARDPKFIVFFPEADLYNPFTDAWSSAQASPSLATGGPGGSSVDDSFYAFGGDLGAAGNTAFSYNLITDSWTAETNMNAARQSFQQQVASA